MATPRVIKRLLRASLVQWLMAGLASAYSRIVIWTSRLDRPALPPGGPFVIATWHGRLLFLPLLGHNEQSVIALISANRDGQLISKLAALHGISSVGGSTSRDARKAIRELMRLAREGHSLYITPDGPRGPRMKAQTGVVGIAQLTGLPVLPASGSTTRGRVLGSWDRFFLPHPFSRIVIRWGDPIHVGGDAEVDATLAKIEAALNACQQRADADAGRSDA